MANIFNTKSNATLLGVSSPPKPLQSGKPSGIVGGLNNGYKMLFVFRASQMSMQYLLTFLTASEHIYCAMVLVSWPTRKFSINGDGGEIQTTVRWL